MDAIDTPNGEHDVPDSEELHDLIRPYGVDRRVLVLIKDQAGRRLLLVTESEDFGIDCYRFFHVAGVGWQLSHDVQNCNDPRVALIWVGSPMAEGNLKRKGLI